MKMKRNIFQFVTLIFFASMPLIAKTQNCCDFIQKVHKYQDSVKIKSAGNYDIIDSTTFDIKTYLAFFDNIDVVQGMKINVYFFDNFLDGNPYLYALKETQSLESVIDSLSGKRRKRNTDISRMKENELLYRFLNDSSSKAKNYLKPQNTDEGFLQYLFFSEMGEQFALKWHSNYNEKYVICSSDMLKDVIAEYSDSKRFSVDSVSLLGLEKLSPKPTIESNSDHYSITWIEIRTHSGIYKCSYQINRRNPYYIVKTKEERLLEIYLDFLY
jgi:hypothetical protein